jgi:CRP-like cAMP-binding protein
MVKAMKDTVESVRKVATRAAVDGDQAGASGTDYATLDAGARMETLIAIEKMMLLRNVPMFRDLDPDDLEELTRIAGEQHFAAGGSLCREGEPGSDVFLIISGRVRVYTGEGSGERTLDHSGPGACIGEMAALDQAPRSASVAAAEPTRALVLPGPEFKALMLERPEIGQRILEQVVGRMRRLIAERSREVRAKTGS